MRRTILLVMLLTALACGNEEGTDDVTLDNVGDEHEFTLNEVEFRITLTDSDEATIIARNLNSEDDVDIIVRSATTGQLLMSKLIVHPDETVDEDIGLLDIEESLVFEVENIGTTFKPPKCDKDCKKSKTVKIRRR